MPPFETYGGGDPPVPDHPHPPPINQKHVKNLLFILVFLVTHSDAVIRGLAILQFCVNGILPDQSVEVESFEAGDGPPGVDG
jgi:hypothetical protein